METAVLVYGLGVLLIELIALYFGYRELKLKKDLH